MNSYLRKYLEGLFGLDVRAVDDEAWDFLEDLRLQGKVSQLWTPGMRYATDEKQNEIISNGLNSAGATGGKGSVVATVGVGLTAFEKTRAAVVDGLWFRTDCGGQNNEFSAMPLKEVVSELYYKKTGDASHISPSHFKRALGTSDFSNVLADVSEKHLERGFDEAEESWHTWCATGTVKDFKEQSLARLSEIPELVEKREHGEYASGKVADAAESVRLATFGRIIGLTRTAIINDDLEAFQVMIAGAGEAANRLLGDLAYGVLVTNKKMSDGKELFHVDHGNMLTPASLGIDSLASAIQKMRTQKDLLGKKSLNIRPRFFMGPVALEGYAEQFFRSNKFDDSDSGSTRVNPYSGDYITRAYDARLDDESETGWYLSGKSNIGVKMFFLQGSRKPEVEVMEDFETDGVKYKIRLDAAAAALDWRALSFNSGA